MKLKPLFTALALTTSLSTVAADKQLSMPAEAKASLEMSSTSGTPKMKCYVDTPAWDEFNYNNCFSVGSSHTTTAVFQIENASGAQVLWSNSSCSQNSTTCMLPIRQRQSVSVTAFVIDSNGGGHNISATAFYEGYF